MDYFGYAGKIIYVDLTSGRIKKEPLDAELAKNFLGGWGINYRIAWDLIKPGDDPLSPDSPIIFACGPLVGTLVPGAGKVFATAKLPIPASEDGRYCIATVTGGSHRFGINFKSAGYDHLVVTGRAKRPVYLKIIDDEVEICESSDLWGKKDIYETTRELMKRYGEVGVISIGKGGENRVRYAMAYVDETAHLGRHGLAALMGSKNLKAIVAKGTNGVRIAQPKRLMKAISALHEHIRTLPYLEDAHKLGFHSGWKLVAQPNMNPGVWSKAEWDHLYGVDSLLEVHQVEKACTGCLLSCKTCYHIRDGEFRDLETYTGHYLWVAIMGQKLNIRDNKKALKLLDIISRAGLCLLTTSSLIDWVTDLFRRGMIDEKKTGGLRLTREYETYLKIVDMIINREGIGSILADGWYAASRWAGIDARKDYLFSFGISKGMDGIYPARMAKLDPMRFTMGITNPRGGISQQGHSYTTTPLQPLKGIIKDAESWGTPKEAIARIFTPAEYYGMFNIGRLTRHVEDFYSIVSCLGTCTIYSMYVLINSYHLAEFYSAATGIEITPQELKHLGERVYNLYKMLNVREGFSRKDDLVPEIWFKPLSTPDGPEFLTDYYRIKRLTREDVGRLLDDYYDERGWDIEKGIPAKKKLVELGLQDFVLQNSF